MKARYILLLFCLITAHSFAQGTWAVKAPIPGVGRWAPVGFNIGNKGYIGTGMSGAGGILNDFWEYDPVSNAWTQKANYGGGMRVAGVGFGIGNFGYVGSGYDQVGVNYADFWRFDPATNTWTQIANLTGPARRYAVGFSSNGKGYIGTGVGISSYQDFWEYDPISNAWTQKANYMGGNRQDIDKAVFVICDKAYMGTGWESVFFNDFWEFNVSGNSWTQKANFPSTTRCGVTGFSIGNRGYMGLGHIGGGVFVSDFYEYNPVSNSWNNSTAFTGGARFDAPAFVINNKAYVGTGSGTGGNYYNDLWEFTPDSVINGGGTLSPSIASSPSSICAGNSVTLTASGGVFYSWNNGSTNAVIVVTPAVTTTYSVSVTDTSACGTGIGTATVTISVFNPVNAVIACQNVCAGNSATLSASGGATFLWSNGSTSSAITVSPPASTNYTVIVSNGSCKDTNSCTVNIFPGMPALTATGTDASCNGALDGSATVSVTGGVSPFVYFWSPGGGTDSTATGLGSGTYSVTVMDANGCSQAESVTISEPPSFVDLAVPNAFSPNNDGENDEFCMQGGVFCIKELTFQIYNRWGELVYQSNDPAFCWDGSYKGKKMNTGLFAYYILAVPFSGEKIEKKGNVTLIR